MFFDQYKELYQKYRVVGAKITVNYRGISFSACPLFGMTISTDDVLQTNDPESLPENPGSTWVNANRKTVVEKITRKVGIGKYLKQMKSDNTQASVTANPTTLLYAHCWAHDVGNLTTNRTIKCMATVEYSVIFWDLESVTGS
jgi:hypothetical protein